MKNNLSNLQKQEDIEKVRQIMQTVKEIRLACDYTAVDFALETGLTNKAYTMIEREGRGTAVTLFKILSKITEMGMSVELLLKGRFKLDEWESAICKARRKRQSTRLTKKEKMEINRQRFMIQQTLTE